MLGALRSGRSDAMHPSETLPELLEMENLLRQMVSASRFIVALSHSRATATDAVGDSVQRFSTRASTRQ